MNPIEEREVGKYEQGRLVHNVLIFVNDKNLRLSMD